MTMWPYYPDLLARPVPRYTSYPTAAEFVGTLGDDVQIQALSRIGADEELSLYVHIPFCQEICWYCGCNTGRSNRIHRLASYLDALEEEIRTVACALAGRGRVTRIAFGGGSPNALSPVEFVRLVDTLMINFPSDRPVISAEIDPRSFGRDWAMTLGAVGTSRVSLGVQTFDPAIQAAIGRVQPLSMIVDVTARLRANGIASINYDLMYGLPGQDIDSLSVTLDEAIALEPERIALFGYAHVPHLLPRQRRIDASNLPGQDERFAMAALGHERLVGAGYVPVGFDHFALPHDALAQAATNGRLRRNFQGFTEDQAESLIGFGASAISQFDDALIQNEKNSGQYRQLAASGALTGTRGICRDAQDRLRGRIIEDLLCGRAADIVGVDVGIFERLNPFLRANLARYDGQRLLIMEAGRPYSRAIAACFDSYRELAPKRFSTAI